ncbi:MAG: hypothetical protein ACRDJ4_05305 [Actinomycetota bacterium]
MAGYELAKLRRRLLTKLGRASEALEAAWAGYREHPSRYSYDELMKFVPKAERPVWHEKAIQAAADTDLPSLIELLLETREIGLLGDLVRRSTDQALEDAGDHATERAARKLEKTHADAAARLWRALGVRILKAKGSKHYEAAIENLGRARRCYEKAGQDADWREVVRGVRANHHRKTAFMPGFEKMAGPQGRREEPSFLEQAKARWGA